LGNFIPDSKTFFCDRVSFIQLRSEIPALLRGVNCSGGEPNSSRLVLCPFLIHRKVTFLTVFRISF
jgi:hypothetical protein